MEKLNPSSMEFYPGGLRGPDDQASTSMAGFGPARIVHRTPSSSSISISPSSFRSVRSSPSPPEEGGELSMRFHSPGPQEGSRRSPTFRQLDATRGYPQVENRIPRESSISLETLPESEDTPAPTPAERAAQGNPFFSGMHMQARDVLGGTPPVPMNRPSNAGFQSASPVSSVDSGSHFTPSIPEGTLSFEAQLKASPMINEILDRLVRCEYSTREIQRDVGDLHRKVNLLVEHTLGVNAQGLPQSIQSSQPEFKDPFAQSANTPKFSTAGLNGHRGSMGGNIAPNQAAPSDDITQISQRLNTLTSSVGQLLALQTQQHIQATTSAFSGINGNGNNEMRSSISHNDLGMGSQGNVLGHGLPSRPDLRASPRVLNPPMRTWSAGALDLPMRPSGDQPSSSLGRQDPLRDKRRSVSSLVRRDSVGVSESGDSWLGGSPRDSGPMISKWEQLALSPELLRSLAKFGVGPPNKIQQRALPFLLRGADIIAQAPPTQERIAAYVIPAIQVAVANITGRPPNRGPIVIMISTTVDQATQAQRMIRDLGGPIGVRSALGVGTTSANSDLSQELRLLQQNMPHIICGTPQKLHALFTSPGGLVGSEVRFLVLDEVDQLIARNLHEFVFNIVKLLPPPRSRPLGPGTPVGTPSSTQNPFASMDVAGTSPALGSPFQNPIRRFSGITPVAPGDSSAIGTPGINGSNGAGALGIERQTALFSNTVPQDVLNLATAIQLREPVRVLVRRDGNVTHADTTQGSRGLRQFYLYLAFTAGGRSDSLVSAPVGGLGIIGSGRGASSAESTQAREWKLDALADLFDDVEVTQAIVHVGGMTALDTVVYKLASRGLEAVPLHGDMNAGTKLAALNKFRNGASVIMRQPVTKVLVVYDVQVKTPDVSHVPLIINYDLPKAVEEYAHRVAPAIASSYSRAGVIVNFVTATGGDVEMLRSIECFYKIKCPEVPMSIRDIV